MAGFNGSESTTDVDVVVVGAGMAGLYMLYRLREAGFRTVVLESADDVGGTWYWNRYPGARCDVQTIDYSYSFDPELDAEWTWSEKYATQPEILRYLQHVADRHDLRRDIRFSTRLDSAAWDDGAKRWHVRTGHGDTITARHYVMATGCLSMPKIVDLPGVERFRGDVYFTSSWPHDGVDLTGKRVAVIGTGSSGIQSIPIMASEAAQMTVFQRTPNFSMPALNGPVPEDRLAELSADRPAFRHAARWSRAGVTLPIPTEMALSVSEEERNRRFETGWAAGSLFGLLGQFADTAVNEQANETAAEFVRNKIRSIVEDPRTAEDLCPTDHPVGTKRPCLDSGYYETFNLPHVRLVNLRRTPITAITETGIDTSEESMVFDVIVYATGFDAMTGAIVAVDVTGRDGLRLADKWADGPRNYLGLTVAGFPNFFAITGPGSPSVLSNMAVSIEQHVEWVADCIEHLRADGLDTIEATRTAEDGWVQHVSDYGAITLFPKANSWYMGANVPGKPRVFLPYVGGVDAYRTVCDEVVARDYLGFRQAGPAGERCKDGVVRFVQPDAQIVMDMMAALNLPPIESMSPVEARSLMAMAAAQSPTGPAVGEVVDGVLPAAGGDLRYRLFRPATGGPHPLVVYFHGGGWVLGSEVSDEPFCRELCVSSGAIVVSVDYRHAPEARFPAAVEDGFAAVRWVADNTESLGGIPGRLAVCGWSAGGNIAAVVCQLARDAGGPDIAGQALITPVTDGASSSQSFTDNAEGYVLTAALMGWFWDHYADRRDRLDPRASPLRAPDLSGLPPALVVTAELDPLRDEGKAYGDALAAAGVKVEQLPCRGQTHTSITAVGIVKSSQYARDAVAAAVRRFFAAVPVGG